MGYKPKYKLEVEEGSYESDNLFFLFCQIILHRFWHLLYGNQTRINQATMDR